MSVIEACWQLSTLRHAQDSPLILASLNQKRGGVGGDVATPQGGRFQGFLQVWAAEICDFFFFSLNYGAPATVWLIDEALGGLWSPISVRRRGMVSPSEQVIMAGDGGPRGGWGKAGRIR